MLAAALLAACRRAPQKAHPRDPTLESWYAETVSRLVAMSRNADALFREGKQEDAAALITQAQPLINRVLAVPRPTLRAVEAASDLDDLYGRMLLTNRNYGWARLLFQKNLARWKTWKPETPETARRRKLAEQEIAECDRHLNE